jgi:pseudouridine synthase
MRLNRFIAQAGLCSRRKADNLIADGKIKVNGKIADQMGIEVDENNDVIECGGKIISIGGEKVYLALNKPAGYITSSTSAQGKSVMELVCDKKRIYPVGRLDKESRGLLLLTNDGDFAYKLTQAKFSHEKEYEVTLDRQLAPADKKKLEQDMIIDGEIIKGIKVGKIVGNKANLILQEGVNRQIRRMAKQLGYEVHDLRRIRIGKLRLGNLVEGSHIEIKPQDVI